MTKKYTTHIDSHTLANPYTAILDSTDIGSISTMEPQALRIGSTVVTEKDLEDLLTLMDVLRNMPDDHPLAEIKQQMHTYKAFKKLEDHTK